MPLTGQNIIGSKNKGGGQRGILLTKKFSFRVQMHLKSQITNTLIQIHTHTNTTHTNARAYTHTRALHTTHTLRCRRIEDLRDKIRTNSVPLSFCLRFVELAIARRTSGEETFAGGGISTPNSTPPGSVPLSVCLRFVELAIARRTSPEEAFAGGGISTLNFTPPG